jgi:hypothetical protein
MQLSDPSVDSTWPRSFGYDQGMMGGVNTSPDYVETMKLGFSTYVVSIDIIVEIHN